MIVKCVIYKLRLQQRIDSKSPYLRLIRTRSAKGPRQTGTQEPRDGVIVVAGERTGGVAELCDCRWVRLGAGLGGVDGVTQSSSPSMLSSLPGKGKCAGGGCAGEGVCKSNSEASGTASESSIKSASVDSNVRSSEDMSDPGSDTDCIPTSESESSPYDGGSSWIENIAR